MLALPVVALSAKTGFKVGVVLVKYGGYGAPEGLAGGLSTETMVEPPSFVESTNCINDVIKEDPPSIAVFTISYSEGED